jgi:hypothetical protein
MEMVETTPVISLLVIMLMGVWGFVGGPTAFLPAFLMYFMVSANVSVEPIAQDAVNFDSQSVESQMIEAEEAPLSSVITPRPIPVP